MDPTSSFKLHRADFFQNNLTTTSPNISTNLHETIKKTHSSQSDVLLRAENKSDSNHSPLSATFTDLSKNSLKEEKTTSDAFASEVNLSKSNNNETEDNFLLKFLSEKNGSGAPNTHQSTEKSEDDFLKSFLSDKKESVPSSNNKHPLEEPESSDFLKSFLSNKNDSVNSSSPHKNQNEHLDDFFSKVNSKSNEIKQEKTDGKLQNVEPKIVNEKINNKDHVIIDSQKKQPFLPQDAGITNNHHSSNEPGDFLNNFVSQKKDSVPTSPDNHAQTKLQADDFLNSFVFNIKNSVPISDDHGSAKQPQVDTLKKTKTEKKDSVDSSNAHASTDKNENLGNLFSKLDSKDSKEIGVAQEDTKINLKETAAIRTEESLKQDIDKIRIIHKGQLCKATELDHNIVNDKINNKEYLALDFANKTFSGPEGCGYKKGDKKIFDGVELTYTGSLTKEQEEHFKKTWDQYFTIQLAKVDAHTETNNDSSDLVGEKDKLKASNKNSQESQGGIGTSNAKSDIELIKQNNRSIDDKIAFQHELRNNEKAKLEKSQQKEELNSEEIKKEIKHKAIKVSQLLNEANFLSDIQKGIISKDSNSDIKLTHTIINCSNAV